MDTLHRDAAIGAAVSFLSRYPKMAQFPSEHAGHYTSFALDARVRKHLERNLRRDPGQLIDNLFEAADRILNGERATQIDTWRTQALSLPGLTMYEPAAITALAELAHTHGPRALVTTRDLGKLIAGCHMASTHPRYAGRAGEQETPRGTGPHPSQVTTVLLRLERRGLIRLHRGTPAGPAASRRKANVVELLL